MTETQRIQKKIDECSQKGGGRVVLEPGEHDCIVLKSTQGDNCENITLQDINWYVPHPFDKDYRTKPTGSARTRINPNAEEYGKNDAHLLAININGLTVNHLRLSGDLNGREKVFKKNV